MWMSSMTPCVKIWLCPRTVRAEGAFSFELARISRFPEVAWLAPDPDNRFKALTELIASHYPDFPPYEGIHDQVIPHLTVAQGGADLQDRVEADLTRHLPIRAEAREVTLLVEDETGAKAVCSIIHGLSRGGFPCRTFFIAKTSATHCRSPLLEMARI
jgi:hypothetical protein